MDQDNKADEQEGKHVPPTREDLNDTGHGMPLTLGGGGYGGTNKTVETPQRDDKEEEGGDKE